MYPLAYASNVNRSDAVSNSELYKIYFFLKKELYKKGLQVSWIYRTTSKCYFFLLGFFLKKIVRL